MSDLVNVESSLLTENDDKSLDILLSGNRKFNAKVTRIYLNVLFDVSDKIAQIRLLSNLNYFYSPITIFCFVSCIIDNCVLISCNS